MAFFGGKPAPSKIGSYQSYRILIFVYLLCSFVIWIEYRGYLNAELAIRVTKYPFTDLESLSKTDYL